MSVFSSRFHPPPPLPSCPCPLYRAVFLLGRLYLVPLDNRCRKAQVPGHRLEGRHHRHPPVAHRRLTLRRLMRCHPQLRPTIRHPQRAGPRSHNVGGTTKITHRVCLLRLCMARQTLADALLRLLRPAPPRHHNTNFRCPIAMAALVETAQMRLLQLVSKLLGPVAS